MAAIRIPGTIHLDKTDDIDNDNENNSISDEAIEEELNEVDPLDNEDNFEIDYDDNDGPTEHADINVDEIAGNESGYDLPLERLQQEIKLAEHDESNNKIDESLRHRIRITALSRIVYPVNHWKIGKYETDLAHCYIDMCGPSYAAQCESHANDSLKILSQHVVEIFNEVESVEYLTALISTYYALARAELILKKTEESEKSINKALHNLNQLGKFSSVTDDQLFPLKLKLNLAAGKIALRLQKLSAASNYYVSALEMIQGNKGSESVDLIPIYQFLGKIEQSNGNLSNHSKAIENYLMAHTITNKHYECHSEQVVQSCRALATAYSIIGTVESEKSAETYLKECLESLVLTHGGNHPLVCEINTELACILIRCDRKPEALTKLKSNLKKEKTIFGEYSEQVLATSQLIGSLQLSSSNMPEALKYYEKALLIEELQNGPHSKLARNIKQMMESIKMNSSRTTDDMRNRPRFIATHRPA